MTKKKTNRLRVTGDVTLEWDPGTIADEAPCAECAPLRSLIEEEP